MLRWEIMLLPSVVALLLAAAMWGRHNEKREWNKGVCSRCGLPWKRFDRDSQGGRGYTDASGHTIWISYNVDR